MKKTGLLILVLVLALGVLGVGYGLFTQQINVEGYVNTGTVSAEFNSVDVGTVGVQMSGNWADPPEVAVYETSGNPGTILTVEIDNAYPSMVATIPIVITNNGSLPIGGIVATPSFDTLPSDCLISVTGITYSDASPLQVGASTSGATITVTIPTDEPYVTQGTSYTFSIAIVSTQYVYTP